MVSVIEERLGKLDEIELRKGGHSSFDDGVCAMELVAWLAGEPHSDHPKCASPVLTRFAMSWNDALDDEGRQKLKPLLPRIVGTANDGHDEWRAWLATDWLVRVCAPAWLELAGVKESAAALRALPPIVSTAVARESQPVVDEARAAGAAARAAARDAAWAAARAAARAAAWAAIKNMDISGLTAGQASDAARSACVALFAPTRATLQRSALELLEAMLNVTPETLS